MGRFGIALALALALELELGGRWLATRSRGRPKQEHGHEKLDVYRVALEFLAWVGELVDGPLKGCQLNAVKHLDKASQSIVNNVAEGNGKRSLADRARFLDIARGSTFECVACLDGLVVRKRLDAQSAAEGKALLERVTAMLWRMVNTLQPSKQHATTSPRTSASAKPDRGSRSPT